MTKKLLEIMGPSKWRVECRMKDPTLVAANQKLLIKTVRVGGADREEAKQRAIVHFKKRGYQNIAPFFVQEVTA